jgi:hypothetical protein
MSLLTISRAVPAALPALALLLGACSNVPKDQPALAELAPAERPTYAAGTVYHQYDLLEGKETSWRVEAAEGEIVRGVDGEGCRFASADPILPAVSWENCGDDPNWRSGTRTYTSSQGSLWPLRVGNKASYVMSWTGNGGETDTGTLDCEVDGTARVATRAGEFDAFRVVCLQRWEGMSRTRITYWVPGFGPAKFTDTHSRRGTTRSTELLRVETRA